MDTVTQLHQSSLPGRKLVIIITPSIEQPPAGGARGTEAAMTVRGHRRMWLCARDCDERKDLCQEEGGKQNKKLLRYMM